MNGEGTFEQQRDDLKEDSVRKAFKRGRIWLQDHDYTREYDGKAWFIDEPDRQDK